MTAPSGDDKTLVPVSGGTAPAAPSTPVSGIAATIIGAGSQPADPIAAACAVRGVDDLPVVVRDHYEVITEFARGGLGRIVKARCTRTGRIVAIKETLVASDDTARRFAREALITANLQHPAIVPINELGRWPTGEPFYAMKLVAGRSFEDVIAAAPTLDARLAQLSVVVSVAEALAFAHDKQVIHRDLKPANVLVGDFGETVVIDWGLAKTVSGDDIFGGTALPAPDTATVVGSVMGTPHYMPPEQARGERVDARADVYAIGAMLYQLIAGIRPFGDRTPKSVGELLAMVTDEAPTPLRALQPTAPPDLLAIADKAMTPDPAARYPSAGALAEDLRLFTTGQLVAAYSYDRVTLLRRWLRRNRAPVTVAAILLAVSAAGAIYGVARILDERATAVAREHDAEAARADADAQTVAARRSLGQALYDKGLIAESGQRWAPAALYYAAAARWVSDPAKALWAAGLADALAVFPQARHLGHRGDVTGAALSLDGTRALTVDDAGDLHAWTPATGALVASRHFDRPLGAVAVSPRGAEIAVGGAAGDNARRAPATLATRATLRGHTGRIWQLAYSPDGAVLASASEDTTARLWRGDATTHVLHGHTQRVYSVAFASDGSHVATGGDDHAVWMWDVATGTGKLVGHSTAGGMRAVLFSGDDVVATGWDLVIHVWKRDGRDESNDWHDPGSVQAAALSPDGRVLVTGGDAAGLRAWDLASHLLLASLDGPPGRTEALAFSRDGRWLIAAGPGVVPTVWDASALPRLDPIGHRGRVRTLSYTRDGHQFASSADDRTVRRWDADSYAELGRFAPRADCNQGVVITDDRSLVAGCSDNLIRRWAVDGTLRTLPTDVWLRFGALSPDGTQVALGHMVGRLAVLDLARFELVAERTAHAHQIFAIQWTGDEVVTASLDDHVKTWRVPGLIPDADVAAGSSAGPARGRAIAGWHAADDRQRGGHARGVGRRARALDRARSRPRRQARHDLGDRVQPRGRRRLHHERRQRAAALVHAHVGVDALPRERRPAAGAGAVARWQDGPRRLRLGCDRRVGPRDDDRAHADRRPHPRPRQLRDARRRDVSRRRASRGRGRGLRARPGRVLRRAGPANPSAPRRRRCGHNPEVEALRCARTS